MRILSWLPGAPLLVLATGCGAMPSTGGDASRTDVTDAALDTFRDVDRADISWGDDTASADAVSDGPIACAEGVQVDAISTCIDAGTGPRTCLQRAQQTLAHDQSFCDRDRDGLADDFEDALGRSYAIAFAFNHGDGSHTSGDPESWWPDNIEHYVGNSHLIWRVDNDDSTVRSVLTSPTLATLGTASITIDGTRRHAADPAAGNGTNFWLCLDQVGGQYTPESQVASMATSIALANGVDVVQVVHPTGNDPGGRYVFVASLLYFAFNTHSGLDTHEGDMEGGGAMVDLDTGRIVAAYFDRHPSSDDRRLLPLTGTDAVPEIDPSAETSFGNICDATDAQRAEGVRFFDYDGRRHHIVAYLAANGHAMYGYPGNTKILGAGCVERLIVRDTHNGDGVKFVPWLGGYVPGWTATGLRRVTNGVHLRNVGEDTLPRLPWAAYHGQWGCQHATVAKSYPAPWDNARHCRRWITQDWAAVPPFQTANPSADCSGTP